MLLAVFAGFGHAAAQEKFSLSLFHFNIQYVAGGLEGFPSGSDQNPDFDLNDQQVQDLIVTESFEPVLDLFLAHPGWKVTIEMQAYMAEVLEQRHPAVLDKMLELQRNGQLELVSFHYSDQLFLAYPRHDLEWSHRIMDKIYERVGLEVSPVVFCQEGQFGVGMADFAPAHGRSILLIAKNHFKYQHAALYDAAAPLYRLGDADIVIVGRAVSTPDVEVRWNFFDDGELLATGGVAPYIPTGFKKDPQALAEYEAELENDEAQGFRIATIGEFVSWAKSNGVEQPQLPPILDGTWQPPSTDTMRQWMGRAGVIDALYQCERDNEVLTGNVRARHWLLGTETVLEAARQKGTIGEGDYADELESCWALELLGQVSDATGINPFVGEVEYGLEHSAAAMDCADGILQQVADGLGGPYLEIDTASGNVRAVDEPPAEWVQPAEPVFTESDGFEVNAPGRQVEVKWIATADPDITRLEVSAGKPENGERTLEVVFPLRLGGFKLTPGLVDDRVDFHAFDEFDFENPRISLPLANGLLGVDGDTYIVKQTSSVHVAATFDFDGKVRFIDETLDPEKGADWIFYVVRGSERKALDFANRLNLTPTLYLQTSAGGSRGCGCSEAG
ncbi:MAG: hypothetical protein D6806_01085, partial [Deltaproteobacteria bacterium]